jgi:hypothetical protein
MRAYGLIDDDANLTEFGRSLYDVRTDDAQLYEKLGAHILLNLKGMALVRCIQEMTFAGERVTLDSLRHALEERGIHFPKGGKHRFAAYLKPIPVYVIDTPESPAFLGAAEALDSELQLAGLAR